MKEVYNEGGENSNVRYGKCRRRFECIWGVENRGESLNAGPGALKFIRPACDPAGMTYGMIYVTSESGRTGLLLKGVSSTAFLETLKDDYLMV